MGRRNACFLVKSIQKGLVVSMAAADISDKLGGSLLDGIKRVYSLGC